MTSLNVSLPESMRAWRPCLPDADDDMLVELAVAAGCDAIVTHNVRHFGPAHRYRIRVLTPAEILGKDRRCLVSAMSVRLPDWLHKQLRECAKREGVSINQLISSAAAEKLAALMTEEYLTARAKRGSRKRFEAALRRVPDVEPEPFDQLPRQARRRRRLGRR